MSKSKLSELLRDHVDRETVNDIGTAFDLMGVAEEEIAVAMKRWSRARKRINASFRILYPGDLVRYREEMYRKHVQELLERVARGQDTTAPTGVEMLAALSQMSLIAPPGPAQAGLMVRLFQRLFPGVDDGSCSEPYPGAIDEVYRVLARRLKKADRVFTERAA